MRRRTPISAPTVSGARACVRARLACLLLTALALVAAPAAGAAAKRHAAKPKPRLPGVTVAVDQAHPAAAVPADFLGLSFEMSSLPRIARYADRGDFVTMLRSLGPGLLRFGGVSADTRMGWTDNRTPRPSWTSGVIDVDDLRELGALAAASGWHVVLTVGIVHFEPTAAAREVAAAKAALGEWLAGIEIGNEPNSYALHAMRSEPWGFSQYAGEVAVYRSGIEAAAPGVPVYGPDVSGSSAFETWGPGEVVNEQPALLTGHHYPLGCEQKKPVPSIASLLSVPIRRREVGSLRRYMAVARAGDVPFRLDETNSVSCGGTAGISDTFASALWAAGFLPHVMAAGAAGVNMHGNPTNCRGYSPVCAAGPEELSTGELVAQPEWYALLLAKSLVGSSPLPTAVGNPHHRNVVASAFLAADGSLQFVVVDDDPPGDRDLALTMRVGNGFARASVLALTAPSLGALSGVELGGAPVSPDGTWSPAKLPQPAVERGVVTLRIAAGSAALVSVSGAGG